MEFQYQQDPMQPVHGENYDKRAAHQEHDKRLAREHVSNGQLYERFRDSAAPVARNREPVASERAWTDGRFDPEPEQPNPGGYRLSQGEQGDVVNDNPTEVRR